MRYKNDEQTTLGGYLDRDKVVTIKVLDNTGTAVDLVSNICNESQDAPGLYLWDTSNMTTEAGSYFYIMSDGINSMPGKFVYGGYLDTVAEKTDAVATQTIVQETTSNIDSKIDIVGNAITEAVTEVSQDIRSIIEDVQLGNWEIKDNQMIMLDKVGVELARFDLFDMRGTPTMSNVFKRERVN